MLAALLALVFSTLAQGLRYDPSLADFNLNINQQATSPLEYSATALPQYTKSPADWRVPVYTLFLDRFANGDPSNDNANGTVFEQDITTTQLRHGGDLQGLIDNLDYIHGMGIGAIYIAGSPFINLPWGVDSYSPLDMTLLDFHHGTLAVWQQMVSEVHKKNMYVILDHTMATMGDLLAFQGYENATAPFRTQEHKVAYKGTRQYLDFTPSNLYNQTCQYPRFYNETGYEVDKSVYASLVGCYNSDFDQYGDIEAFGVFPDWQRSLAKFASVQDRLRDWHPPVLTRIKHFSCMIIQALDIDGFRFDKAAQITIDALAEHSAAVRECAVKLGKDNFFLPGEITTGNNYGSVYLGRGREPSQQPPNITTAMTLTSSAAKDAVQPYVIRKPTHGGLDAAAFHYSVYRYLTRFLGMSGNLEAGYDLPSDWTDMWSQMVLTNDLVNANTGQFDPRHMYGTTNQDLFRWPAISQGIERQLLGTFITTLHMPGTPLVLFGEEQAYYVHDSTAANYIFGRQPLTSSPAWMMHGCQATNSSQYYDWPIEQARHGCHDPTVSYDHRDPSHPVRNILKAMYAMRKNYPGLLQGWNVQSLGKQTTKKVLPGSNQTATEFGIWSVARSYAVGSQDKFASHPVWLLYHNWNESKTYTVDCLNNGTQNPALYAPFVQGTTVKNLFAPYDELVLGASGHSWGFEGEAGNSGCLPSIPLEPFGFRAYVKRADWVGPPPMITKFTPGHDARINKNDAVPFTLEFSEDMGDCTILAAAITVTSTVTKGGNALVSSPSCSVFPAPKSYYSYTGSIPSLFRFSATLTNVNPGIHKITVTNATSRVRGSTNTVDHFLLRVGAPDNPLVFPFTANYSTTLLSRTGDTLSLTHAADGADKWRYSTNWGSSWSNWTAYDGSPTAISPLDWSGTAQQAWDGYHVIVQYWSQALASSSFIQHGDVGVSQPRRFPHLFAMGTFNKYGFDFGIRNAFSQSSDNGQWEMHLMAEWPTQFQLNVWGVNPDGKIDASWVYGDVDHDGVLDRMPPSSLTLNVLNATDPPPLPALSYKLIFNDGTLTFTKEPQGNVGVQVLLFLFLGLIPVASGLAAVWIFMGSFYKVKVNKKGLNGGGLVGAVRKLRRGFRALAHHDEDLELPVMPTKRRKVIIATMEYNIDDWDIKIKIGGLGVMAQLMGKALEHQDLIWVVPCVGGIDYPVEQRAEPMYPCIMGKEHEIEVQYHQVKNITYVLLDAPIFRQQSKADPYPARMDDMESAIYYSAWNYCIAETIRRFDPDLYHINDYHGAAAPLYLLPDRTIPCALSLHNAEFQGMWPMRNPAESAEVCHVFNLDPDIVKEYVQFGSVFNLLHAGASYLRVHQKGFGAVGVSKKYGDRSHARYPIFWGLSKIGQLPNPDPSDTAEWSRDEVVKKKDVVIDLAAEAKRGDLRRQAQEWAGLEINPDAELFVFVGRWSLQKGVDLIADVFPSVLEEQPNVQLICVGPVIDLYGKFAALKLDRLMQLYPKRVCSKPTFTQLPPYVFSGAEFALIPSRDEPFGLVAVEFGRKGALGVGARVGGLGQMPGFWYTVESTAASHLLRQFRKSIDEALGTKKKTRQMMRAWSAKQRFPVAQWVEDLDKLQGEAIRIHQKEAEKRTRLASGGGPRLTVPSSAALSLSAPLSEDGARGRPDTRGSRRSSLPVVPSITETDHDLDAAPRGRSGAPTGRRLPAIPFMDPALGGTHSLPQTPNTPPDHHYPDDAYDPYDPYAEEPFLPPHLLYANHSARSSNASLATIVINDPYGRTTSHYDPRASTLSVDTFAARLMSADESETGTRPFALDTYAPEPPPHRSGLGLYKQNNNSRLSVMDVVGTRHDFQLQKVDPFFTDSTGEYYRKFEQRLAELTAKNSDTDLCIEEFLKTSEKAWFKEFHDAKLGHQNRSPSRQRPLSTASALGASHRHSQLSLAGSHHSLAPSSDEADDDHEHADGAATGGRVPGGESRNDDEFLLGAGYRPPRGLKRYLSMRVGDWPVYSLILALGQIMAGNSYQIVLLAGEGGQKARQLYLVAAAYGIAAAAWWLLFRRAPALYALSLPWFFWGLAFVLLGVSPFLASGAQEAILDAASCVYAMAAASGALFFAMNFGDEGGAPIKTWLFRAAVIQGIQQLFVVALFYWGSLITGQSGQGTLNGLTIGANVPLVVVITLPFALVLWLIGAAAFFGLPDYYRQSPDAIPSFYASLMRRHLVPWFLLMVVLQNYFLSTLYGRNWEFLFSSQYLPGWSMVLLAVGYFVVLWAALLWVFSILSRTHPWIVPLLAIGLGAPRWAQMLWGTSGIGLYLPWVAGGGGGGAFVSRLLWLWLGLLDAIQGVGIGMILLLTLTRQHVAATLCAGEFLGAVVTILARATAPNRAGPGDVFPDFSEGPLPGLARPWFWIALGAQLVLPFGFVKFFRKEQVAKP